MTKFKLTLSPTVSLETWIDNPGQISFNKVLSIIEKEDPFISADYHLLKERVIVDDKKKEKQEESRTEKVIRLHNARVKKNDYFLFLGDLCEQEMDEGSELLELKNIVDRLHGEKMFLYGNNDTQRWDYYVDLGFIYVTRQSIATDNYLFSHEPFDIIKMKVPQRYINFHGHIHDHRNLFNMSSKQHINCYWEDFDGPLRLSQYLELYESKKLPVLRSVYE
jgi:calcineurin-like phosphoesterase family protein